MVLFLLTFFLLYGSLHYYLLVKTQRAFPLGSWALIMVILFLLLMVLSPLIVYHLAKYGFEASARALALIGFSWMGFAFLAICGFGILDLYSWVVWGLSRLRSGGPALDWVPSARLSFGAIMLLALGLAVYGFFEAQGIRTERVVIASPKIPKAVGPIRIAQISDVHLGLLVREDRLRKILEEVKRAEPDILVSSGDLVDVQLNELFSLVEIFREIQPRYGKFAITGNHEFYAGLGPALDFTRKAGFKILRGEGLTIGGMINMAGVDDPAGVAMGLSQPVSEGKILSELPREKFTILLKHRPEIDPASVGLFDLQISGHTHQGQIFPFRFFTRLFFTHVGGTFQVGKDALLHVNRGTGTWGPPIRFLSPPEVTVYELIPIENPRS